MPKRQADVIIGIDDYQTALRGYGIELLLTIAGRFGAHLTSVKLRQLQLLCAEENTARVAYLRPASALAVVTFPAEGAPEMWWAGVPLGPGDIVFHGQGEQMHQRTTGACQWGIISLSIGDLVAHGKAVACRNITPPPVGQVVRAPPRAARWLPRLHKKACHLAGTKPDIIAHPEVARALDQELIHALVTCLSAGEVVTQSPDQEQRAQIMTQLEVLLASGAAWSMSIPALCKTLGVSERRFRNCCADFLGMSPTRYIWLCRMHRVRAALLHADPEACQVADVARSHGFSQAGRFATAYRRIFGERPADTLLRNIARRC